MPGVSAHPLHQIRFGDIAADFEHRADGACIVRPRAALAPHHGRLTDALHRWAALAPDRIFLAERDGDSWRTVTYAEALRQARRLASAFLDRGLDVQRPVCILSANSLDHGLVMLGGLYAGVPVCSISPPYALMSKDYNKLRYAIELLTPGLVFAEDATAFRPAILAAVPADTEVAASRGTLAERPSTRFVDLLETPIRSDLDERHDAIGPDSIAKFLLTSGSTGQPKAVINTQRMLTANQVMIRETMAFLKQEPPVILDWLPWNHTFGGNHNFGLVLYNGGSFYIDDGRPTPQGIAATLRNLRDISPTVYFNVPKGFEALVAPLRADAELRRSFYDRLQAMFFAGAGLSAHVWQALDDISVAQTGARVPMLTGLGATETAPFSLSATPETSRSGHVGLPVPGNEIKLVPTDGKLEVRVKGPNVTPGYWRQPEFTTKAFDEEGYYKYGDALKPVDPEDYSKGFDFDGRVSEDFKLASGTWVSVGPLRMRLISACAPLVRDVVLAGINRDELAALLILDPDGCRAACPHLSASADLGVLAGDPALRRLVRDGLTRHAAEALGSSQRVPRAIVLDTPLSIDLGEVTDKGSVNQRAVLEQRTAALADLYAATPPRHVIMLSEGDAA